VAVRGMLQKLLVDFGIDRRDFLAACVLLVNAFTWPIFLTSLIEQIISGNPVTDELIIWAAFYLSTVIFGIIGAVLSKRFSGLNFLYSWMALGAIASLVPVLINNFTSMQLVVVSAIFGASFGLGMPSCLAFFAETTKVENRGRIGGIILLIASLFAPLITGPFSELNVMTLSIICAVWRGAGLSVYFLKQKTRDSPEVTKTSFVSILRNRTFLLYFVAWLMFGLVNAMESSIVESVLSEELLDIMYLIEPVIATFFILIAGFMCDWIGRKKIVLSGFVALGAAYAIIGFLQPSDLSWYLYFVVDGAAWGIFYLTFVLILWGDLSQPGYREKYYALGSVPFFICNIIPHFVTVSSEDFSLPTAFSVAAFFLFVAVMPLVFAPETLPEKKIELRRLRSFAEDAKKAKEKYERKMKG
jgi:MFS family permease